MRQKTFVIFVTLNGITKIFYEYLVTQGKDERSFTIIKLVLRNIYDFTKVLSWNIYFGTEFKSFCHESLELYSTSFYLVYRDDRLNISEYYSLWPTMYISAGNATMQKPANYSMFIYKRFIPQLKLLGLYQLLCFQRAWNNQG